MRKKDNFIIGIIGGIIFVVIILFLYFISFGGKKQELDLSQTSKNKVSSSKVIQMLYDRYQAEDGLKFQIVGSDISREIDNNYALYYKGKVKFSDFPDIYKSYILLDLINYNQGSYDEKNSCYNYSLEEFQDIYKKYYGSLNSFSLDTNTQYLPNFSLNQDNICISSNDNINNDYSKVVDTYFVNGVLKDDEIVIYERVAFINLGGSTIDFYSESDMKNKVYSLSSGSVDLSFIHNSKVVSNVLLEYQRKFPIYEYHYVKNGDSYYLDYIQK